MKKKKPKLPAGWTQKRIQRVLEHYQSQTDEDAAAEIKAASASDSIMHVPRELVPTVRSMIAKHQRAGRRVHAAR